MKDFSMATKDGRWHIQSMPTKSPAREAFNRYKLAQTRAFLLAGSGVGFVAIVVILWLMNRSPS
jgi:hypothetical protein